MSNRPESMSIGALARAAGVNVETIRFYERKGLLPRVCRRGREIRQYTADQLGRVKFVQAAKGLGFTLAEVGALLQLEDGTHCDEVRSMAEQKLADVREKLEKLQRIESALERILADCRSANKSVCCPLIASLQLVCLSSCNTEPSAGRQRAARPPHIRTPRHRSP
jgi:MerR family transcriptional regulator, mercuric resistance operon regulatory protein